jgi:hypothetical protein
MKIALLFLFLLLNISKVLSGTIDPDNSDNNYTSYAKYFTYVGRLTGLNNDESGFVASAVAIDDHRILTAAHIIVDSKKTFVSFGQKTFYIEKFVVPKEFKNDRSGIADIAIGYSSESFNMSFYPPLYNQKDEEGKVCCICGFGGTGNFLSGVTKFDMKKRAGSNIVDEISKDLLICNPSHILSSNRTSLEFLIASGDSGGGLFIDGKLAGINSCIISQDSKSISDYSDVSGHTRISNFIDWILENKRGVLTNSVRGIK